MHAGFSFAVEHPEAMKQWYEESNYVVILQVPDEASLMDRFARLNDSVNRILVREPDIDAEATAFAVLGTNAGRILSDLPLALREVEMV